MLQLSETCFPAAVVFAVLLCSLPATEAGRSLLQLQADATIERAVDLVGQVSCSLQV